MGRRRDRDGREEKAIPTGRLGRLARIGRLAAGLAGDLAGAAASMAVKPNLDAAAERFHRAAARELRHALGRMKGLPMKVGQLISYLDDFIPPLYREIYRDTLRALQVKASPMRWQEIEAVVEADLGAKPDAIFAHFDRKPIAAASIGQVYRAALPDGTEVAVKVQYPGIADAIRSDLKNIDLFRSVLALMLPKVDVERSLADLTARVLEECDYGCEINNQEEFRRVWDGTPDIVIPRVFQEFSGDHVLVSEYVSGLDWHQMLVQTDAAERCRFGRKLFRFVFRSLFVHGIFNADPHPGNYLFLQPGDRVAFLDFGCVQRYDRQTVLGFRHVRHLAMAGIRGPRLFEAMRAAYGLPDDLDGEQEQFIEEYILCCLEPALVDRTFRYDRSYTERLRDLSMRGAMLGARKVVSQGIWEAKRPGLIFLNRLQYGFASVLAAMEAEANWRAIIAEIDAEVDRLVAADARAGPR